MTSRRRMCQIVSLILGILASVPALASFEIEPRTSSERGAATHMALGMLEDSYHLPHLECADSLPRIGVALHAFRPFGINEMRFEAVWGSLAFGASGHGICVSYQRFGALSYLEETYLIGCCLRSGNLRFQPRVRFGVVRLEDRWMDSATLFDFAFAVRIRQGIRLSLVAENPLASTPLSGESPCPTRIGFGLGHLVSPHLAWGLEVAKGAGHPTCIAAGIEGRVVAGVTLRSGLRSDPQEFCLGLGLLIGALSLDISTSLNLDLGATHAVGVTYLR
jgi:hypothetical protein